MHKKVETLSKFVIHKEFQQTGTSYAASFSEDELQQTIWQTQFSSTADYGIW